MNLLISTCITFLVIILASLLNNQLFHWFVFPLAVCGIILGTDAVAWGRGQLDTFDIKGIIGIFALHFYFLSPLLFITADLQPVYPETIGDWRHWLGWMGIINAVSIILYKLFERVGRSGNKVQRVSWQFNPGRSSIVLFSGIALAFLAQAYILKRFGGLSGIAAAQFGNDATVFAGAGIPRMMANSSLLLCAFAFFLMIRRTFKRKKNILIGLSLLTLFSTVQLVLSGVYSARGLVVTSIVWVTILYHYFWRPIRAKFVITMLVPLFFIGWIYSFYKDLGPKVIDYLEQENAIQLLEQKTGRSIVGSLIGDLSRADVHAYMLYRLHIYPESYDLRYGRTYLEDFSPIIPYWIWRAKPINSGKVMAGTELLWGKGFYKPGISYRRSNRAYGLGGEAMLNFGPHAVPFVHALWGFLVGRFRRYVRSLPRNDLRLFIVPYFVWFIPNMLAWDLDNWMAHSMARAVFPILIVWLLATKVRVEQVCNDRYHAVAPNLGHLRTHFHSSS